MNPQLTVSSLMFIYDTRQGRPRLDDDGPIDDTPNDPTMGLWWVGQVRCDHCTMTYVAVIPLYVMERQPTTPVTCGLCGERQVKPTELS